MIPNRPAGFRHLAHAAAELLPPGRPTELVRDRVAALRTLTEDLLEISRLDTRSERLDVDAVRLAEVAERVVRASGTDTEVRVVRDAVVETDRRRLERVLGNLVANAHKHGRAPVSLTVDGPLVTVRDHGDGSPAYLVEHGPQRFRTEGGQGAWAGADHRAGAGGGVGGATQVRERGGWWGCRVAFAPLSPGGRGTGDGGRGRQRSGGADGVGRRGCIVAGRAPRRSRMSTQPRAPSGRLAERSLVSDGPAWRARHAERS